MSIAIIVLLINDNGMSDYARRLQHTPANHTSPNYKYNIAKHRKQDEPTE